MDATGVEAPMDAATATVAAMAELALAVFPGSGENVAVDVFRLTEDLATYREMLSVALDRVAELEAMVKKQDATILRRAEELRRYTAAQVE